MTRWRQGLLAAAIFYVCGMVLAGAAGADDFLAENKGKTVFIQAFPDANMLPTEVRAAGSGVLLKDGYVLTARHFAEHGALKGPDALVFQGRIGDAEAQPFKLSYIAEEADHDLLLLKFNPGAQTGGSFACLRDPDNPAGAGDDIVILGFPQAANVTAGAARTEHYLDMRRGAISAVSAAQMFSDVNVTYGHSGAPVFDSNARLVGIVRGELKVGDQGTDTAVLVPIARAESMLPSIVKNASDEECGDVQPAPVVVPPVRHKSVRFTNNKAVLIDALPDEAFEAPERVTSPEDLDRELSSRPAVTLMGSTFKADTPEPLDLYLSSLKLDRSTILIGAQQVRIFVKDLNIVESKIEAFPDDATAAGGDTGQGEGAAGGRGADGLSAGSIEIYVTHDKDVVSLDADLRGQAGGQGGQGGRGAKGAPGAAGTPGSDHVFDCARGPGDGERGKPGGAGGAGGRGGDGGNGGFLTVYVLEGGDVMQKEIYADVKGGAEGRSGAGGPGGPGGDGGPRGEQTNWCHGGANGPAGETGSDGPQGPPGNAGERGRYNFRTIAIEDLPIPGLGEP